MSQPTRAAWIEIFSQVAHALNTRSQPTRAAWIEILNVQTCCRLHAGRSPLGLRGLK